MNPGDRVLVFPAADPKRAVHARVVLASENANSLLLSFGEHNPAICENGGLTIHPLFGFVLVLLRDDTTTPFWKDIFAERRYGVSIPG